MAVTFAFSRSTKARRVRHHPRRGEPPASTVRSPRSDDPENIPGAVPHTSTYALNNATLPDVLALADKGWRAALKDDPHLRNGSMCARVRWPIRPWPMRWAIASYRPPTCFEGIPPPRADSPETAAPRIAGLSPVGIRPGARIE
ncbi:hypothetical protein [Thiocapsa sp.]|uniref:hypothetical protein n=1 Tax=Thiocapsa sp. TaxID=2024551 RepID=UPI00345A0B3D